MLKMIVYIYVIIAGIVFVWLNKVGKIEVRKRDGSEIEKEEESIVHIMKFFILAAMSIMWLISIPILVKRRNDE